MTSLQTPLLHGVLVEDAIHFTLIELSRACHTNAEQLVLLVEEGVLLPSGDGPQFWRFDGHSLRRARTAVRLSRDLELSAASTAVVLDLLDQIEALRAQLRRLGRH